MWAWLPSDLANTKDGPTHTLVLFSGPSLLEKSAFVPASQPGIPILSLGGW